METGKELRLRRFCRRGGTVVIPLDHALFAEPPAPLVDLRRLVKNISETEADGILVSSGMVKYISPVVGDLAVIIRLDGTHTRMGKHLERIDLVTSVESVLALGADMVVVNIFVGTENEDVQLAKLGKVATDCRRYGVPLLAEMIPASTLNYHYGREKKTAAPEEINRDICLVSRLGAEIGADCIKTHYSGNKESFKYVTESTPVPVWIAGGPKSKSDDSGFLKMIEEAVEAGAKGVTIARNVWQRENPREMIRSLCKILHHS